MFVMQISGELSLSSLTRDLGITSPDACQGRTCWLIDLTEARLRITGKEVERLAAYILRYRSETSCFAEDCFAAIATTDDTTYGLLRMLQVYLGRDVNLHVGRELDEAQHWLEMACEEPPTDLCVGAG